MSNKNITGKLAEHALEESGIALNKNMVPFDTRSPFVTSGIRIGTPAVTTRGLKEEQMLQIVDWIDRIISDPENENLQQSVKAEVAALMGAYELFAW